MEVKLRPPLHGHLETDEVGRPHVGDCRHPVLIHLSPAIMEAIAAASRDAGLPFSTWVETVLIERLRQTEHLPPTSNC